MVDPNKPLEIYVNGNWHPVIRHMPLNDQLICVYQIPRHKESFVTFSPDWTGLRNAKTKVTMYLVVHKNEVLFTSSDKEHAKKWFISRESWDDRPLKFVEFTYELD